MNVLDVMRLKREFLKKNSIKPNRLVITEKDFQSIMDSAYFWTIESLHKESTIHGMKISYIKKGKPRVEYVLDRFKLTT